MGNKPYIGGFNYLKRRGANTDLDYGHGLGKAKKPYRSKNHKEKEHYHQGNYKPYKFSSYELEKPCQGRAFRVNMPLNIECGKGKQEIEVKISSDYQSPVLRSDADSGVFLTSDKPVEGFIPFPEDGKLIFDPAEYANASDSSILCITVCDEVCGGCSIGCSFLGDCADCADVDCGLPSITGGDTTTTSNTLQMGLSNAQGSVSWAVSGTDVTIDQTGLVTTGASACGTFTVTATDSCCGDFTQEVRVTNNGTLVQLGPSCTADEGYKTGGPDCQEWVGGTRTQYWYCVGSSEGCEPHCGNAPCAGDPSITYVKWTERQSWECLP